MNNKLNVGYSDQQISEMLSEIYTEERFKPAAVGPIPDVRKAQAVLMLRSEGIIPAAEQDRMMQKARAEFSYEPETIEPVGIPELSNSTKSYLDPSWQSQGTLQATPPDNSWRVPPQFPSSVDFKINYDPTENWNPGAKAFYEHLYKPNAEAIQSVGNAFKTVGNGLKNNPITNSYTSAGNAFHQGRLNSLKNDYYKSDINGNAGYNKAMEYYSGEKPMPAHLSQHAPASAWVADALKRNPDYNPAEELQRINGNTDLLGQKIPELQQYITKSWTLPSEARGGVADSIGSLAGQTAYDIYGLKNSANDLMTPYMESQLVNDYENRLMNGQDKYTAYSDAMFDARTDPANILSIPGLNSLKFAKGGLGIVGRHLDGPMATQIKSDAAVMVRNAENYAKNSTLVNTMNNAGQKVDNVFNRMTGATNPMSIKNAIKKTNNFISSGANSIVDDNVAQVGRNIRDNLNGSNIGLMDNTGLPENLGSYMLYQGFIDKVKDPITGKIFDVPKVGTSLIPYNPNLPRY